MKPCGTAIRCVCGKLCTSKPGLTLHQRNCAEAQAAIKASQPAILASGIIEPEIKYLPEVQELSDLMKDLAVDAHQAITNRNKSAGRRARAALIQLKEKITPLRKLILQSMRDEPGRNQET
jgi:hypothetical protein